MSEWNLNLTYDFELISKLIADKRTVDSRL